MFYSVGFTQNLVYLERHLDGFNPTLMEDLSVLWSKEIYLRVWIWTSVYRSALASGHCFFTIYASKLFDVIKVHLPTVHCYADDTQLYVSFSPNKSTGQFEAVTALQHCVDDIRNWMTNDKLFLNDNKTEFLMIGSKQQLAKVNIYHIFIGDCVINKELRDMVRLHSFDEFSHVNNTCSNAFYYL